MVYMIETNEKEKIMNTVETTLENEWLDNLEALCVEKEERNKRIEAFYNRIANERYMIATLEERMTKITENYHQDVVNTVEAALTQ